MDSQGDVYPSIMWNYRIGDIREAEYDLGRIWNGTEEQDARPKIKLGQDPKHWTSCEAYQSILGDMLHPVRVKNSSMELRGTKVKEPALIQE